MASEEATNYNNDSIIIEDSPAAATRKSIRKSSLDVVNTSSTKLCEFPLDQSDTVTVSSQDYATLEHDTFLNDIIIDFYLTHLFYTILPSESRDSAHIFSTMFYKRLLQTPKKDAKKVAAFETDPSLSKEEKQHLRVAGWTKNVDLFKKDFVIIPICEYSHWYLVVVVNPGKVNVLGERTGNPVEAAKRVDTLEDSNEMTGTPEDSEKRVDTLEASEKRVDTLEASEKRVDTPEASAMKVDTLEDSKMTRDTPGESEKRVDTLEESKKKVDTPKESEKRVGTPVDADERTDTSKDSEKRTDNEEDLKEKRDTPENSEERTDFPEDSEERTNSAEDSVRITDQGEPFFLVLDSLGGIKSSAVTNLKNYLSYEWRSKMCCKDDQAKELVFSNEQIKTFHPKKPEQKNWSDCGIFLLHYVEKMFQDLDQFLHADVPDLSDWFTIEEVGKKRAAIAVLIRRLAKQQVKVGEVPNFPNIKFKDESRARKSPKLVDSFSSKDIYSPIKDVNENVNKNEEVGGMKVIRSNSSKQVSAWSSFSQKGPLSKSSKRASPATSKESDTRSSDPQEDFTFDPSNYLDTTATCSEMSESTKCSSDTASAISSSVSTTSSAPSNSAAMSSSSAAKSATKSSNSSGRNFASGTSANFMDVWNATKNNLVIGDYARFASSSTVKKDGKGKRKRFGLETFKSLQQEASNDGNLSSRNSSDAPEMHK